MRFLKPVLSLLLVFGLATSQVSAIGGGGVSGYGMDDYLCPCGAYKEQCEPHEDTCDVSDQMFCSEVCGGGGDEQ